MLNQESIEVKEVKEVQEISEVDILMQTILEKIPNWSSKIYYEVKDNGLYIEALENEYEELVDIIYNRLDRLSNIIR